MSSSIFWSPPASNDDNNNVKLPESKMIQDTESIALIDISASTSGWINDASKRIVTDFQIKHLGVWATNASYVGPINAPNTSNAISANGGTKPVSILQNNSLLQMVRKSNTIFFTTDGQIDQMDMQNFMNALKKTRAFSKACALVCILIGNPLYDNQVATSNISVFYPLFTHPRCMLLHCHQQSSQKTGLHENAYRVLFQSAEMKHFSNLSVPMIETNTKWEDFPLVETNSMLHWSIMMRNHINDEDVPDEYEWVSEPANTAFSLDAWIRASESTAALVDTDTWDKLVIAMPHILLMQKASGRLQQLRGVISKVRESLHEIKRNQFDSVIQNNSDLKQVESEMNTITEQLIHVTTSTNTDNTATSITSTLNELRVQLSNVRTKYDTKYQQILKDINEDKNVAESVTRLKITDGWLRTLQELESSGYRASDLGSSSLASKLGNRAKRAEDVNKLQFNDAEFNQLTFDGAPTTECTICLDQGQSCLLLRKDCKLNPDELKKALEEIGQDYCMDLPLSQGASNLLFLSPDTVCLKCAQYLYAHNGVDTTRSKITAIVPVVSLENKQNTRYVYQSLANGLAEKRALPHLHLLFFAILDAAKQKDWGKDENKLPLLEYMLNQLLQYSNARTNFQQTGLQASLQICINTIIDNEHCIDDLLRQPISAIDVILRYYYYNSKTNDNSKKNEKLSHKMLRAVIRQLVCSYVNAVKPNDDTNEQVQRKTMQMKQQLLDCLFTCPSGIPIAGSARLVGGWNELVNKKLLVSPFVAALLTRNWSSVVVDGSAKLLTDEMVTYLLCQFYVQPYDPVEKFVEKHVDMALLLHPTNLMNAINILRTAIVPLAPPEKEKEEEEEVVIKEQNQNIHFNLNITPAYVTPDGPSVIACVCGSLFITKEEYQQHFHGNGEHLMKLMRQRRDEHFKEVYHAVLPFTKSQNTSNLHHAVLCAIRHLVARKKITLPIKEVTRTLIIQILHEIWKHGYKGQLGQIFKDNTAAEVVALTRQLFQDFHLLNTAKTTLPLFQKPYDRLDSEIQQSGSSFEEAVRRATTTVVHITAEDRSLVANFTNEEKRQVLAYMF